MKRHLPLLSLLALASLPAHAVEMHPGKWQIVMKNGAEDGFTMTQCMNAQQLDSQTGNANNVPGAKPNEDYDVSGKDGNCTYRSWRKGDTSHIESTCEGETSITDVTHKPDSFKMKSVVTGAEKTEMEMTGTRIGDC